MYGANQETQEFSGFQPCQVCEDKPLPGLHGSGNCRLGARSRQRVGQDGHDQIGRKMAMAVLPATRKLDFDLLKHTVGAKDVELAGEQEFANAFPGCELGAMPPFGNLYDMDVFVAESLAEDEQIAFNAGSHTELLRLGYADYERLVRPNVAKLTC